MTSATTTTVQSSQPDDSHPTTINVSPSQRLEQLPIAALLAFVPRLRTTYRVLTRRGRPVATSRTHYRIRLGTGSLLHVSDNLLDLIGLIDGRRNIQALSDALAELQGRPVHPAEIVYLIRLRLAPAGLAELSFPPALPEPKPSGPLGLTTLALATIQASPPATAEQNLPDTLVPAARRETSLTRAPARDVVQWAPPGRRTERLRTTRRPSPLIQQRRRASYISLLATFLLVFAAAAAFSLGHTSFSHVSFTLPGLSAIFGGITPTATLGPTPTSTPAPPPHPRHYSVQDGDTLAKIAARFRVTEGALVLVNNLKSPTDITTDQTLIIPTVYYPGANIAHLAYPIFYVVQPGDNLYTIATTFGVSTNQLIQYNHMSANAAALIHPGDWLVIPAPAPNQSS